MNIQLGELGVAVINEPSETAWEQEGASQRDRHMVQEHANTRSGAQDTQGINGEVGRDFLFFFSFRIMFKIGANRMEFKELAVQQFRLEHTHEDRPATGVLRAHGLQSHGDTAGEICAQD